MVRVLIAGDDPDELGSALESHGATVAYVAGTANRPALEEAGVLDAAVLVITDVGLATSIVVANDLNPNLRIVVYSRDSLPEFAKGLAGHILDPELLDVETVASELTESS